MNARLLAASTLFSVLAGVLPASAADPQLLNLVMADAKVLAGVNVDQAKGSPFGQYVLSQMQSQNQEMQNLVSQTGFDPTRDVSELLVASNGTQKTGLALARGTFSVATITAFATAHQAVTESYAGVTILEDPKQTHGIAFLSSTYVAAGDVADVKAAIDRQKSASILPASLATQVNQWSTTEDAWVITTVPPSTLHPAHNAPAVPGVGNNAQNMFQGVQSAAAGVKFGATVVTTAVVQADNAQDATGIAGAIQFLANLAQMQAGQNNAQVTALVQGLKVTTQGATVNISLSLPADQFQQLLQHPNQNSMHHRSMRKQ
jgi:hypothetical protein